MLEKIQKMQQFLIACRMTEYLMPEQIALLSVALDVLKEYVKNADDLEKLAIDQVLEARTAARIVRRAD